MNDEINEALVGAEQLREMINHSISLGSNSLLSQAYQVKSRVKSATGIREKIEDKIAKGKGDYRTNNVMDIVGFRFLTLFQQDLLSIVERFVNYVESFQSPPTDLFLGKNLKNCVEEVIVYQSNSTEEIYESIYSFLEGFFVSRGFPSGFVKLEKKDTRYSSVHFIVRGQVHLNSEIKVIPIEFQLRTVFEDVWGEVQHFLMYKNPTLTQTENMEFRKEQGERILSILKANIDGCSEQANLAYFTLKTESPGASLRQAKKSVTSNLTSVLEGVEGVLGSRSSEDVDKLRQKIFEAYQNLHQSQASEDPAGVAVIFKEVADSIRHFDEKWSSYASENQNGFSVFRYGVDMEKAATYYWIGQALNDRTLNQDDPRLAEFDTASSYFERARQIYFKLTALDDFAADPVLNYRIGQIYRKLSQYDLSIIYYKSAYKGMFEDNWKDKGSIFDILIPRHLAYIVWSQADGLLTKHIGLKALEVMSKEARSRNALVQGYLGALKEAFILSWGIEQFEVKKETIDVRSIDEEKGFAFNNGLWYAVEFLEYGGSITELSDGDGNILFNQQYYLKFEKFSQFSDRKKIDISALDTLLLAATYFKDEKHGCGLLEEFEARRTNSSWADLEDWQKERFQLTIEKAKEKLNC